MTLCYALFALILQFVMYRQQHRESVDSPQIHIGIECYSFILCDNIMYFLITHRWLRPDISERTGLAVMEIDIPTGYRITNDVLRSYAQSGDVPTMRRAEEYGRKVVYYFDYVSIQ